MKVLICVFSGTGHTFIAAKAIEKNLKEAGVTVDLHAVKKPFKDIPDTSSYDYVGLGYPIHAFNAPKIFVEFCRLLPKNEGNAKVFFFKTSGEPFHPNSASSILCYKALKKKGYETIMDVHMLMPYNIMFRYKDGLAKQMYLYTKAMCKMIAKRIINKEEDHPKYNPFTRFFAMLLRIEWVCSWAVGPFYHVKKDKCTNCHSCVKRCPASNIRITEKGIKFGVHCTTCMRCVFECPQDAIRPGILNPWRVNGRYDFKGYLENESLPAIYITNETKGYFKHFRKYYHKVDEELKAYQISIYE